MIELTRLNGTKFLLNPELIEQMEATPDTVITLVTGNNLVVRESLPEVRAAYVDYRAATVRRAGEKTDRLTQPPADPKRS